MADEGGTEPAGDGSTQEADRSAALARPIDFSARYGEGADRALVLGGGGLFFVAWQVAYLHGLAERGVDLGDEDLVVGTSAGSLVATIVAAGHLRRTAQKVDVLAKVPSLLGLLSGEDELEPSQQRALELFAAAPDAEPSRLREIGHAALAAQAPPPQKIRRSIGVVLGVRRWPSPSLHITAVDAYTAERLVITKGSGIPVALAAASSSSVPGLFTPQQLHDRRAVDGGVSGTGIHADLAAGARRALVLSLSANMPLAAGEMTSAPGGQEREMAELESAGTRALLRGPTRVDRDELMDPQAVAGAVELGEQQADADADEVLALWG